MLEYKEQIKSIYDFIKRSEVEQKNPFAYEVFLITSVDETALTPRTSGIMNFNEDIDNAVEKAKQVNGGVRVDVYTGKAHNSRSLNNYIINVSGEVNYKKDALEERKIKSFIKDEIIVSQQNGMGNIGEVNSLIGMLSGNSGNENLNSLLGLVGTITQNNQQLDKLNFEKRFDDFKNETKLTGLQEKHDLLKAESISLQIEKDSLSSQVDKLLADKTDLENRLEGYAPNELMKRTAIGVISNIGSRLLGNSSKTAQLIGLTPQELKGALGIADDEDYTEQLPTADVEIQPLQEVPQTPEEKKKAEIVKNISDALEPLNLTDITKMANVLGLCLENPQYVNSTIKFLIKQIQAGNNSNNTQVAKEELSPIQNL